MFPMGRQATNLLLPLFLLEPCLASVIPGKGSMEEGGTSGFCISTNSACLVDKEQEWAPSNLLNEYNRTNYVGCSERCNLNSKCNMWTWWGNSERCQIFSTCTRNTTNCTDCQTGPRKCGIWEEYVTAVSGGKGGQNTVYMVEGKGMCESTLTMPTSRWGHSSSFIQSKLILCGGTEGLNEHITPSNTCNIYDLEKNRSWVSGATLNTPRHGSAGLQLLGKMFMIGGWTVDEPTNTINATNTVEVYDPRKDTWTEAPSLPLPVAEPCAVAYRDSIVVSGGTRQGGEAIASHKVFIFNLTLWKWESTTPMQNARTGHGCSLDTGSATPSVIVTGGEFEGTALSSVESFNLVTRVWADLEPLPYSLKSQGQSDLGQPNNQTTSQPAVLGGLLTGEPSPLALEYTTDKRWKYTRWWLPANLAHHSVTLYPRELVKCRHI